MDQGVIYFNKGTSCILRLIVCINSLRRHYDGPITIMQETEPPEGLYDSLGATFGVDVIRTDNNDTKTLVRKLEVSQLSPYDYTLYIDADMLVLGDVSEFFEEAKNHEFVASHFTDWKSSGGTISRRIKRYSELCPDYIKPAIKYGPAINTGIYAYPKNSRIWKEWESVAKWGMKKGLYIPDEVSMQVIAPQYDVKVLPSKYNVSVLYGNHIEDKRVIHYHGRKHCKEFDLCDLWVENLMEVLEKDICKCSAYVKNHHGDRRLRNFLRGNYGRVDTVNKIHKLIGTKNPIIKKEKDMATTIVTACDPKYVEFLKIALPNWIKYKGLDKHPFIVYVHGFDGTDDKRLDFLREHPDMTIIEWDLEGAESQRERMLSSFVLGPPMDVKTPYWMKIDADTLATNNKPLFEDKMYNCDFCGHRWGYTKPHSWIKKLDEWAGGIEAFKGTKDLYDPDRVDGRRYNHPRTNSFCQLHKTEFCKEAVGLLSDSRLPVPSHDTYFWYVAERLGKTTQRHNFKRFRGMTNTNKLHKMVAASKDIDQLPIH